MTKILTSTILILSPIIFSLQPNSLYPKYPNTAPSSMGSTQSLDEKKLDVVSNKNYLTTPTIVTTKTRFTDKVEVEVRDIPFETSYIENPDMEYGREKVVQEGIDGTITNKYLVSFWEEREIRRTLIHSETEKPVNKVVERGTKVVWKTLSTERYGDLKYWHKLNVFATSYDGNCTGCRGLTFSGTLVKQGVCAVDPNIIPLGTNFYVEGYGLCRSEDIGGAIKGNRVDLGFENVKNGFWSARYTNIYLLTNSPSP